MLLEEQSFLKSFKKGDFVGFVRFVHTQADCLVSRHDRLDALGTPLTLKA